MIDGQLLPFRAAILASVFIAQEQRATREGQGQIVRDAYVVKQPDDLRHRQAQMFAVNKRIRPFNQFSAVGHEQVHRSRHGNHAQRFVSHIQHKDAAKRRRMTVINGGCLWFLVPLLPHFQQPLDSTRDG